MSIDMSTKRSIKVEKKERLQFDFSPEALKRLDAMKEHAHATTRAEVVRDALRVYEWLLTEVQPSHTIIVVDDNAEVTRVKASLLLSSK